MISRDIHIERPGEHDAESERECRLNQEVTRAIEQQISDDCGSGKTEPKHKARRESVAYPPATERCQRAEAVETHDLAGFGGRIAEVLSQEGRIHAEKAVHA